MDRHPDRQDENRGRGLRGQANCRGPGAGAPLAAAVGLAAALAGTLAPREGRALAVVFPPVPAPEVVSRWLRAGVPLGEPLWDAPGFGRVIAAPPLDDVARSRLREAGALFFLDLDGARAFCGARRET